jgi:hypothetical protein
MLLLLLLLLPPPPLLPLLLPDALLITCHYRERCRILQRSISRRRLGSMIAE